MKKISKTRTPDMTVEEFLDFIFNRLLKRYSKEEPENMLYEDQAYRTFLQDMRNLSQEKGEVTYE